MCYYIYVWSMIRAHGDGYDQTVYKGSVRTATENNKVKEQWGCQGRTIGCPYKADHRTGWGLMVTRWGVMPSPRLCPRAALSRNKK